MKTLIIGLSIALAVLVGWLLAAIPCLRVSDKIDAGNVLNACATFIVAVLIGYFYTERSSSKRADTGLLLEALGETKARLGDLQVASIPCHRADILTQEEQTNLVLAEREFSNSIHSFEHATSFCKVNSKRLDFVRLKDARAALKISLTDTPFPGPYDSATRARISRNFKTIRDELTRMGFEISRR